MPLLGQSIGVFRVAEQAIEMRGQPLDIVHLAEQAVAAVLDDCRGAADSRGDDRLARRHRLDDDPWYPFHPGGQDEHRTAGHQRRSLLVDGGHPGWNRIRGLPSASRS